MDARQRLALVAVIAVIVGGLGLWLSRSGGDGGGSEDASGRRQQQATTTEPSTPRGDEGGDAEPAPTTTSSSTTTSTTTTPTTRPQAPPTTAAATGVPPGWTTYRHPQGAYTIAYPPGWQVVPGSGPRVQFRDPNTGTYLMVDWTDQPRPDPVADWQQQAPGFAARHEAYQEIRIAPFSYRDYNAAVWEFRYRDGGVDLHVANLGFVAGSRGYALYFQTHEDRWAASQQLFAQLRAAFQPAG